MGRKDKKVEAYCICRKSHSNGGMVCCDKCDEWFHFKCIGIKEAPDGDYFCQKCISNAKQCANPECVHEARKSSKYCSDKCGYEFNRQRYLKFFRPKWEALAKKHSTARGQKMSELERLENECKDTLDLIGKLKSDNEELVQTIHKIKDHAKELASLNRPKEDQMDSDSDQEDEEETISGDQTKTFCIICGVEQPADKAFRHWTMCHKKQESTFNFTSDIKIEYSCEQDPKPDLYCMKEDKKTKRFCLNLKTTCPQHANWQHDPDEICACPLNVMQNLELDGNYCLKSKKDCLRHYNWDRFRLASKNMERLSAFERWSAIQDKTIRLRASLNDTYGGVVGVMLHNTIDEDVTVD